MGVSEGAAVAVTSGCEKGSLQAVMVMERIKTKGINVMNFFDRFMGTSFFGESICLLYKQAALMGGVLV